MVIVEAILKNGENLMVRVSDYGVYRDGNEFNGVIPHHEVTAFRKN